MEKKNNIDIVFVSLTRTIETALNIFKDANVKIVAIEEIINILKEKNIVI